MNRTVRVYESKAGAISAVVYKNGKPINLIAGIENEFQNEFDFIQAARTGFQFAENYDPSDHGGILLDEVVDEIDYLEEEIAMISSNECVLYKDYMGEAGLKLFLSEN